MRVIFVIPIPGGCGGRAAVEVAFSSAKRLLVVVKRAVHMRVFKREVGG